MEHLWSPWRYQYIQNTAPQKGCIFCDKAHDDRDEQNLIIHRGKYNFIILNLFPYTSGHLMVAPYQHAALLNDADDDTLREMILLAKAAQQRLGRIYKPHGFNLGMNLGESAGAGVAGHIHLHLLPRWTGDANFMTTVGETRVMPEDLHVTYRKLAEAFGAPDPV